MLDNVKQMQGTGSRRRIGNRLYWAGMQGLAHHSFLLVAHSSVHLASQGHLTYIQTVLHQRKLWPDEQVQCELLSRYSCSLASAPVKESRCECSISP
jgi:hypothetical protein